MYSLCQQLAASSGWIAWSVRACMLLAVWNAPTPFIHQHDIDDGTESIPWKLAEHIARFHHCDDAVEGWHVHWFVPTRWAGDTNCPNDPLEDHLFVGMGIGLPSTDSHGVFSPESPSERLFGHAATHPLPVCQQEPAAHHSISREPALPFLSTYSGRITVRDVLSVSLC